MEFLSQNLGDTSIYHNIIESFQLNRWTFALVILHHVHIGGFIITSSWECPLGTDWSKKGTERFFEIMKMEIRGFVYHNTEDMNFSGA